jgi:hypothetical protein
MSPTTRTTAASAPTIALNRVKTLARTISRTERDDELSTVFVRPSARRSATSSALSPLSVPSAGGVVLSATGTSLRAAVE